MSDAAVDDGVVGEVHVDSDGVVGSVVGGADVAVVGVDDLLPKNAVHFLDCQLAFHLLTSCNRRYQSKTPSEDDVHDDRDPWIRWQEILLHPRNRVQDRFLPKSFWTIQSILIHDWLQYLNLGDKNFDCNLMKKTLKAVLRLVSAHT